jgi:hypothetical protein
MAAPWRLAAARIPVAHGLSSDVTASLPLDRSNPTSWQRAADQGAADAGRHPLRGRGTGRRGVAQPHEGGGSRGVPRIVGRSHPAIAAADERAPLEATGHASRRRRGQADRTSRRASSDNDRCRLCRRGAISSTCAARRVDPARTSDAAATIDAPAGTGQLICADVARSLGSRRAGQTDTPAARSACVFAPYGRETHHKVFDCAVNIRMFITLYWPGLVRTVGLLGPKAGGARDF